VVIPPRRVFHPKLIASDASSDIQRLHFFDIFVIIKALKLIKWKFFV